MRLFSGINNLQGLYPGYIIFFVQSALMIAGSRGILLFFAAIIVWVCTIFFYCCMHLSTFLIKALCQWPCVNDAYFGTWKMKISFPVLEFSQKFPGSNTDDVGFFFGKVVGKKKKIKSFLFVSPNKAVICSCFSCIWAVIYRWQQAVPPKMDLFAKMLAFTNFLFTLLVLNYSCIGFMVSTSGAVRIWFLLWIKF